MGHWPKSMKRKRARWVHDKALKLTLVGCSGSHSLVYLNTARTEKLWRQRKRYYIERGNDGSEQGNSEASTLLRMARRLELY